jgi:hypothetical protein
MLENRAAGFGGSVTLLVFATVACGGAGSEDEGYRYGAAEVEQLIVGSWTGTWTDVSGGPTSRLSMEVSRFPAQRAACGSRQLGEGAGQSGPASALQCVSTSEMALQGTLSVDGAFSDLPLTGDIVVVGFEPANARLTLMGSDHTLTAGWSAGSWQECRVRPPNFGALLAECTLERSP